MSAQWLATWLLSSFGPSLSRLDRPAQSYRRIIIVEKKKTTGRSGPAQFPSHTL